MHKLKRNKYKNSMFIKIVMHGTLSKELNVKKRKELIWVISPPYG